MKGLTLLMHYVVQPGGVATLSRVSLEFTRAPWHRARPHISSSSLRNSASPVVAICFGFRSVLIIDTKSLSFSVKLCVDLMRHEICVGDKVVVIVIDLVSKRACKV